MRGRLAMCGLFASTLLLAGCEYSVHEDKMSAELSESAEVADLVYTPANHGANISPTVHMTGEGDLGFGMAFTSVDIPARYAVVFQCQHGKFIIQDDQVKAKELWGRLKSGQHVTVRYKEVYREEFQVTADWRDRQQSKKLTARKLQRYSFIDAN